MSLRDLLKDQLTGAGDEGAQSLYEHFGILKNPFPPAGAPGAHPHQSTPAEERINRAVVAFHRDQVSQVLLVEGTQGVGKTNFLSYFQNELQDLYQDDKAFYIIRYYPDPEASFDGIIRRIFQEFGEAQLISRLARRLAELPENEVESVIDGASGYDMRLVLRALLGAARRDDDDHFEYICMLALEWLVGLRLLKSHRENLGVQFRLDTVESKTQALRDMVFCCAKLGLLRGIFLLLDELEKQDYSISKVMVLRYLSAIRALIDSLPRHLFMLVALTTEAKRRYFLMLPAFAGRLQNSVVLEPLKSDAEALSLAKFYLDRARESARNTSGRSPNNQGNQEILPSRRIRALFLDLLERSAAEKGLEGVSQRDFLNALHEAAEDGMRAAT
jgi:hypothetical protein